MPERTAVYKTAGLPERMDYMFFNARKHVAEDYEAIYHKNEIVIGNPTRVREFWQQFGNQNLVIIVGGVLGDEGKGRFVDNKIEELSKIPGVEMVHVIRFQGGSNAGHTVGINENKNIDLHQVPSFIKHVAAVGIMDSGMVINPDDLRVEVGYIEKEVGSLRDKLYLSHRAHLNDDLDRAQERLNSEIHADAQGGTGRGMSTTMANFTEKTGYQIKNLVKEDWETTFGKKYDEKEKIFAAFGKVLADQEVPDFEQSHVKTAKIVRRVGSKEDFLERLRIARSWLIERDMVKNTYLIHHRALSDKSVAVLQEGAQAIGLDLNVGTRPDTTSSDTTPEGIKAGTLLYKSSMAKERIGVIKVPYISSVGNDRKMPTLIPFEKDKRGNIIIPKNPTDDQKWAMWIREEANEYGTTTQRPRDILHLDLEFMRYNAWIGNLNMLVATHLDVAEAGQAIKVCTHYTNSKGEIVPYQPDLEELQDVEPHYIELPGWDGKACRAAKTVDELPENAQKFLAFLQAQMGLPIVAVTTGPKREHFIDFPEVA